MPPVAAGMVLAATAVTAEVQGTLTAGLKDNQKLSQTLTQPLQQITHSDIPPMCAEDTHWRKDV